MTEHDFFERGEARAHKAELPCENVIAIGGTGACEIWMVRSEGECLVIFVLVCRHRN